MRSFSKVVACVLGGLLVACNSTVTDEPGGSGGSGGSGGGSADCAALVADYQQKAAASQQCSPFVNSIQCAYTIPDKCGCPIPANQSAAGVTDAYNAAVAAGCFSPCPVNCEMLSGAVCQHTIGSSMGTCAAEKPH